METKCPECEKTFDVPDVYSGREGRCSSCGLSFLITPNEGSLIADDMPDIASMIEDDQYLEPISTTQPHEPEPEPQPDFVAPAVPKTCITKVVSEPPRPATPQKKTSKTDSFDRSDSYDEPAPKKTKKKRRPWFTSAPKDVLPGQRVAFVLSSLGVGGVAISYIIFVLTLAKDLSLSMNGDLVALKRMMIWIGIAAGVLFISLCQLAVSAIIRAINNNTMEMRSKK